MSNMIWAQFRSATISIDAFGSTEAEAYQQMRTAWKEYATQNNQNPNMLDQNKHMIEYREVCPTRQYFVTAPHPVIRASKAGPEAIDHDKEDYTLDPHSRFKSTGRRGND